MLALAEGQSADPDAVVQEEIDDDGGEVLNQIPSGGVTARVIDSRSVPRR